MHSGEMASDPEFSDRDEGVDCDVTGTQGSGIPAGIGADSRKFRLWTGIPGIRDCRRLFRGVLRGFTVL